jgi:hypothetical protein
MMQQNIAFANRSEDVGRADESLGDRGCKRRIVQTRLVDAHERPQIGGRKHPFDRVAVDRQERELIEQHVAQLFRHPVFDFKSHGLAEAALAKFGFDHREEIVGLVFLQVEVGVARHAERIRCLDRHPGEELAQVVRDDVFDEHEPALAVGGVLDRNVARQGLRHFDAREVRGPVIERLFEFDGKRQREIGDIRKRMTGIDSKGREHGKHALHEKRPQRGLVRGIQVMIREDTHCVAFESRQEPVPQALHLPVDRNAQPLGDCEQLLFGKLTVVRTLVDLGVDLLFEARDADHKVLVEVGPVNRNELQAFEQGVALVERLFENAVIELNPRKLAVNV